MGVGRGVFCGGGKGMGRLEVEGFCVDLVLLVCVLCIFLVRDSLDWVGVVVFLVIVGLGVVMRVLGVVGVGMGVDMGVGVELVGVGFFCLIILLMILWVWVVVVVVVFLVLCLEWRF